MKQTHHPSWKTLAATAALLAGAGFLVTLALANTGASKTPNPPPAAVVAFEARVKDYLTLHRKLEGDLPKLGAEASLEEIDKHQRALGAALKAARTDAKHGEFFSPEMQRYLKQIFARIFQGKDGKNALGSIMDENPGVPAELAVNERYPDTVPLSTMPPDLLTALPQLEEDMEYRFVGRRLVLLDAHAHIIIDFTDELLPR